MATTPKPSGFLLGMRLVAYTLVLGWVVFSFFFVDAEGRWATRIVFLAPVVVPLAIVEYLYLRSKQRAALAVTAASLGLSPKGKLLGQRLVGQYRGFEVDYATEADNELGKGTCLELRATGLEGLAVGSRHGARAMKRAAGKEAKKLETGQKEVEAWSADGSWQAALTKPEVMQVLVRLSGTNQEGQVGAVLGPRVLRALYGRHQSFDEVKRFIDEAVDAVEALRASRGA